MKSSHAPLSTTSPLRIVATLLKHGADVIAVNGDGATPLEITEDDACKLYLCECSEMCASFLLYLHFSYLNSKLIFKIH